MVIEIQAHMETKDLVLLVLQAFEQPRLSDLGKRQILQLIMILLLKHELENKETTDVWGTSMERPR